MKKLLTLMAAMLMVLSMKAQTPMILGENHAMLKLAQDKTFLLLPVQECFWTKISSIESVSLKIQSRVALISASV